MTVEVRQVDVAALIRQLRERVPEQDQPPLTKQEVTNMGYRIVTVCADDSVKPKDGA